MMMVKIQYDGQTRIQTTFLLFLFRLLLVLILVKESSTLDDSPSLSKKSVNNGERSVTLEPLPADGHLAAHSLPAELSGSFSCTCDHSSKCIENENSSCGARIFYLVGIHNNRTLNDAVFLFRAIRDARNIILIHIDVKFGLEAYKNSTLKQEIDACPCGSHVEVASVHNASWSSWSMNRPTLWGMEKAVKEYSEKWDVFINLSGDTLPVYNTDRIAELFGGPLAGINFITSSACETGLTPTPIHFFPKHWHKRAHYSHEPARLEFVDENGNHHFNYTLETYFGSQWMALTPEWCQYLVHQLERPDSLASRYRDYLIKTGKLMSDETFMPTLLMHLFPETTPKLKDDHYLDVEEVDMYDIRYERMDEHVPSSHGMYTMEQRYEVPESSGIEMPRPWGPYFLGVYDLANIKDSGALYVRKVASSIDHNLFEILPVDDPEEIPSISWPKEVEISPAPDWEEKLTELKRKHEAEKAKAEVEKDDGVQHMEQEQAGTREVANEKVDKVASPREKTKDKEADVNPEQHGGLEEEDNSEGHKSEHNAEDQLLEM